MDLSVSCRLKCFFLCPFYFSGWFHILAEGDVCACQPYGCNKCPSSGPCTRENVALGKPATTSSLYNSSQYNETSGPACLAVNGNTNTTFRPVSQFPNDPACVHTADGDNSPYWEVDLGEEYTIVSITVFRRSPPDRNRLETAKVSIDDKECYKYTGDYNTQPVFVNTNCTSSLQGCRVKIQSDKGKFITVCQVQVWVCSNGYYGSDCLGTCGNCSNGTCDPSFGLCPQGCTAGYQLPYCKEICKPGFFGVNCSKTCGNCQTNSPCNVFNGSCEIGCAAGYQMPLCKVCDKGFYGADCKKTCGNCSKGTTCDSTSRQCPIGCNAGYQGVYCNQTCRNTTYGVSCKETCGKCVEDTPCHIVTGHCETGCAAGYYPPLCNTADTDRQNECSGAAGPIVGAVLGSIAACVVGFLLGILFTRCRVHQKKNPVKSSVPAFSPSHQTEFSSSPPKESKPPCPDSDYQLPSQPDGVYNSLKAECDDNVYTKLNVAKEKGAG